MKPKQLLCVLSLLIAILTPSIAHADPNNFVIQSFNADETLLRDDPQGSLHIVETIKLTYNDYNHGILRAIPKQYKGHSLQLNIHSVRSSTGAPVNFTTSTVNDNTVLRIGDANRTITGAQEYTIDYTLHNVITFYDDHDELYFDVNGDQWGQQFDNVSVLLHTPSDVQGTRHPLCFTGSYGTKANNCTVARTGTTLTVATNQPLKAYETLTYAISFSKGYFAPQTTKDTLSDYSTQIISFVVPFLLISGFSLLYWYRLGRDPKGRGVIVPEYQAPDSLRPLAAGCIMEFVTKNAHITATIVDLAVRKYIKIIESKEVKALRKDSITYKLELLTNNLDGLDKHEKAILNALFDQQIEIGRQADIGNKGINFAPTAQSIHKRIAKELTEAGYFRSNPRNAGSILTALVAVSLFAVFLAGSHLGFGLAAGLIAGGIISYLCARAAPARTSKGVDAKERLLGLKMYLDVAEKDRIRKLQAPNAAYAQQPNEPVKTVELFEKLLPYAMVLGVEQQWAEQFKDLYTVQPDWYSGGNWNTFNAAYLASSLSNGIGSAVDTSFATPSSSSSSGFGGGGFSGGGGGGGGGGGW